MAVIINGRVVDPEGPSPLPLSPPRAWAKARESLEASAWTSQSSLRVVAELEPEALVFGLPELIKHAPPAATVECVRRIRESWQPTPTWLNPLRHAAPPTSSALLAAWANERTGVGAVIRALAPEVKDWSRAVEVVGELFEPERSPARLRKLANDRALVKAVDESSEEKSPPIFVDLLIAASGPIPTGWLANVFATVKGDRALERRLKRSCFELARADLLALLTTSAPPLPRTQPELIERAFASHVEKTRGVVGLAKPATVPQLAEAERALGFELPAGVRVLWALANGQSSGPALFGALEFLSAAAAVESFEFMRGWCLSGLRTYDEYWDKTGLRDDELFSDKWVPIAARDYSMIVISAETGRVFAVEKDVPPMELAAQSLGEWLNSAPGPLEDEEDE